MNGTAFENGERVAYTWETPIDVLEPELDIPDNYRPFLLRALGLDTRSIPEIADELGISRQRGNAIDATIKRGIEKLYPPPERRRKGAATSGKCDHPGVGRCPATIDGADNSQEGEG